MKKIVYLFSLVVILVILGLCEVNAQVPQSFQYQAEARNSRGKILVEERLSVKVSIIQGTTEVYQESHDVQTDINGLFNLNIGEGVHLFGGLFSEIDWENGPYYLFIQIAVGISDNYVPMGTTQLLSVPYALHANSATSVDNTDDADADPYNEIQDLNLNNNILTITNNNGATQIDLSKYLDNSFLSEEQVDNMVSNNGYQLIADDNDTDNTNELQSLTLTGNTLELTLNGATVDLSKYLDNTDNQLLSINGHTLSLTNGGSVTLPDEVDDADADPTNELQNLNDVLSRNNDAGDSKIVNLADPENPKDVVNKQYVDVLLARIEALELALDTWNPQVDRDEDGFSEDSGDCDDDDPTVYPGATEICGDGIDQDCNGSDLVCETDIDQDGYTVIEGDCDDHDPTVNPGMPEVCNDGIDNDCDGSVDANDSDCLGCFDSYEPNDNCGSSIHLGTVNEDDAEKSWTMTIYPNGDEDYFKFYAEEGSHTCFPGTNQSYSIRVRMAPPTGANCTDLDLYLLDDNCTQLSSSREGACTEETIDYTWSGTCGVDDSRYFRVMVKGWNNVSSCEPYTLKIDMYKN